MRRRALWGPHLCSCLSAEIRCSPRIISLIRKNRTRSMRDRRMRSHICGLAVTNRCLFCFCFCCGVVSFLPCEFAAAKLRTNNYRSIILSLRCVCRQIGVTFLEERPRCCQPAANVCTKSQRHSHVTYSHQLPIYLSSLTERDRNCCGGWWSKV